MSSPHPSKLFDQVIYVSLTNEENKYKPKIEMQLDPAQVPHHVPLFCFPEAEDIIIHDTTEEFAFVLTDSEGNRQYGFCRRFLPSGKRISRLPVALCILTHCPWFALFSQILEIGHRNLAPQTGAFQPPPLPELWQKLCSFWKSLLLHPIPDPGRSFGDVHSLAAMLPEQDDSLYNLTRPQDHDGMPCMSETVYRQLFSAMQPVKLIILFTAFLCERRVIMHSRSIEKLAAAIHGSLSFLYPFTWQNVFIPVVPKNLLHYCEAPMPFIVGTITPHLPLVKKMSLESVVFVDLDNGLINANAEDVAMLPKDQVLTLRQTVDEAIADTLKPEGSRYARVVHAFREFFLSLLWSYRRFLLPSNDARYAGIKFDREGFIRNQPRQVRQFLRTFCQSQMFERFISEREAQATKGTTPATLFEKEIALMEGQTPTVNKKDRIKVFLAKKKGEAVEKWNEIKEERDKVMAAPTVGAIKQRSERFISTSDKSLEGGNPRAGRAATLRSTNSERSYDRSSLPAMPISTTRPMSQYELEIHRNRGHTTTAGPSERVEHGGAGRGSRGRGRGGRGGSERVTSDMRKSLPPLPQTPLRRHNHPPYDMRVDFKTLHAFYDPKAPRGQVFPSLLLPKEQVTTDSESDEQVTSEDGSANSSEYSNSDSDENDSENDEFVQLGQRRQDLVPQDKDARRMARKSAGVMPTVSLLDLPNTSTESQPNGSTNKNRLSGNYGRTLPPTPAQHPSRPAFHDNAAAKSNGSSHNPHNINEILMGSELSAPTFHVPALRMSAPEDSRGSNAHSEAARRTTTGAGPSGRPVEPLRPSAAGQVPPLPQRPVALSHPESHSSALHQRTQQQPPASQHHPQSNATQVQQLQPPPVYQQQPPSLPLPLQPQSVPPLPPKTGPSPYGPVMFPSSSSLPGPIPYNTPPVSYLPPAVSHHYQTPSAHAQFSSAGISSSAPASAASSSAALSASLPSVPSHTPEIRSGSPSISSSSSSPHSSPLQSQQYQTHSPLSLSPALPPRVGSGIAGSAPPLVSSASSFVPATTSTMVPPLPPRSTGPGGQELHAYFPSDPSSPFHEPPKGQWVSYPPISTAQGHTFLMPTPTPMTMQTPVSGSMPMSMPTSSLHQPLVTGPPPQLPHRLHVAPTQPQTMAHATLAPSSNVMLQPQFMQPQMAFQPQPQPLHVPLIASPATALPPASRPHDPFDPFS